MAVPSRGHPRRPSPQVGARPPGVSAAVADTNPAWWWSALVALAALALYLTHLPPVSGEGDSSEFTLVVALNGVAHPTGYPLYTLLGHWFVRVVHALGGGWAQAAAAWSALGGAVAVGLLHALAARLVPPGAALGARSRSLLALLPAAFFLTNPVWTDNTIVAEVYSWHLAVVCSLVLMFVTALRRGRRGPLLMGQHPRRHRLGFLAERHVLPTSRLPVARRGAPRARGPQPWLADVRPRAQGVHAAARIRPLWRRASPS